MLIRRTVLIALVTGLAFPAEQALADDPPPPDIPSVAAYVEMGPTSRGPKQTGAGASRPRPLPPRVDELLRTSGGDDAALLEQLATSPGYGAPTGSQRKQPRADEAVVPSDRASSNALSAAVSVSADGGEGRLLGLIVALVAVTLAIGIVAVRRRPCASS
jgi:hypothetical protein